jgi:hypothetical protein
LGRRSDALYFLGLPELDVDGSNLGMYLLQLNRWIPERLCIKFAET